jgi:Zn-dependent protease
MRTSPECIAFEPLLCLAGVCVDELTLAVILYVVFLVSVTLHEAGHAWAALRGGDPTAYAGGQVTLDPRPHIRREPLGMVLVPVIGIAMGGFPIGWASTPYDPRWAYAFPRRAAWMALAGPAANLLLVVAAGVAMRLGVAAGWLEPGSISIVRLVVAAPGAPAVLEAGAMLLSGLYAMNLLLLVLNLMPVPPLDGSAVIGLLLSEDRARRVQLALNQSGLALLGLLIAFIAIREGFWPIFTATLRVLFAGL